MKMFLRLLKEQHGTTLQEYAIITCAIALAGIFAMIAIGFKYLGLLAPNA